MRSNKLRIGIAHPRLERGGSEARAMWGIEAFKADYAVSLITSGNINLPQMNQYYGTQVRQEDVTICKPPFPKLLQKMKGAAALRGSLFQRYCQKIASEFDALISTYNFCDFGVPALQCIADFSWDEEVRGKLHPQKRYHQRSLIRNAYMSLTKFISPPPEISHNRINDMIIANSRWSANIIKKKYNLESKVLYPPVLSHYPEVDLSNREYGFVCIGRISPEKRIERIIEILSKVRTPDNDLHLHIIGEYRNSSYGRHLKRLSQEHQDWITLDGSRMGLEKIALLSQHRFGIHACQGEAFGISVAEMVKAGCITFVPNEGGQTEIVNHPLLLYDSVDDAVDKIKNVLQQQKVQVSLRDHLSKQGEYFSSEIFMEGLRTVVQEFLEKNAS